MEENAQQVRIELAQHSLLPNVDVTCGCKCDFDCDVVLKEKIAILVQNDCLLVL